MKIQLLPAILALFSGITLAQSTYVDRDGTWRYSDTDKVISAFGVNYAPMFAHSYRRIKQLGFDHKKAIRDDIYHFSRLGLDAFRVHIWDTEITDHEGNLLKNEHLDLLDYTVAELRKRHINVFLTTLGLLNNGYPDDATETPGFWNIFDKQACSHVPQAFTIQANYLKQLMKHTNPYTGFAYKDDPAIIGIELNNEPYHRGTPEQTKQYIQTLIQALRDANFKNPLFYNMSQNPYLRETYYSTDIDGFTFQWYPTGLSGREPFTLNLLPYINEYPLATPQFNFGEEKEFKRRARIIYEFGLSNTLSSYAYAPVAEALREAGFQLAAYFSYDPMSIAAWNTEYPKHFLNLAYTPRSAIGLMIAAEAFRGADGISYDASNDQSLLNNGDRFIYSNGSAAVPKQPDRLKLLAGTGSSPLVRHEGTGAYFFDRLADNAWRMELMPDAIPLRNPFSFQPTKQAVGIEWKSHDIQLDLPGLEENFTVTPITDPSQKIQIASEGRFLVTPGVYLLGNYPVVQVSSEFAAPPAEHELPPAWHPHRCLPEHILVDGRDSSRLFFSHGSKNKANVQWGTLVSVTTRADCYGWDPKFVQFGYAVSAPETEYTILKLSIESFRETSFPIQVELGMDTGKIFGSLLELAPGKHVYDIALKKMKPVALARYDANPSFLPALSTDKAPGSRFNLSRIESLRFTIGPELSELQKKNELGLSLEKAWLK